MRVLLLVLTAASVAFFAPAVVVRLGMVVGVGGFLAFRFVAFRLLMRADMSFYVRTRSGKTLYACRSSHSLQKVLETTHHTAHTVVRPWGGGRLRVTLVPFMGLRVYLLQPLYSTPYRQPPLFFEKAPVGIALLQKGVFCEANELFRTFTGEKRLLGRPLSHICPAPPTDAACLSLERHGRSLSLFSVEQGEQEILYLIDTSSLQKIEEQALHIEHMRSIGQLAGGLAHDLNNMLTAILGFTDLLREECRPGDPNFVNLMHIKHTSERASRLVRKLLAFSRKETLSLEPLYIGSALEDISFLLQRLIAPHITLDIVYGSSLFPMLADRLHFEQMVVNLALNARDAMPEGGQLLIQTEKVSFETAYVAGTDTIIPGDYVCMSLTDTGIGMSKDTLEHIFEPFFTTKSQGQGTGLGLSMVYGGMKQFGGYVFVDSPGPGKGSTFTLYFKRASGEPKPSSSPDTSTSDDLTGKKRSLLLVDDEGGVRLFSARALRSRGYQVTEADHGEAALQKLRTMSFDLLITDMLMPLMDGATLIRQARALDPHLPILCMSGYTEGKEEEVFSWPHVTFMSKPFSLQTLIQNVKKSLK